MKVLAVGDIHCKPEIIDSVLRVLNKYDKVVFIGDYADDWGKSPIHTINIWKKVKNLQEEHSDKVVTLIGNHDFAYLLNYNPNSGGFNPMTKMLLNSPENKGLKRWLGSVKINKVIDGVKYSHAGYIDGWSPEDGLWDDLSPLWVRPNDGGVYTPFQVFGHTPSETCWEVQPNVWCIDTFSTYRDGSPYGDCTTLEVIDGKKFNKIRLR